MPRQTIAVVEMGSRDCRGILFHLDRYDSISRCDSGVTTWSRFCDCYSYLYAPEIISSVDINLA